MERKTYNLKLLANEAMRQRGLVPDFSDQALDQLATIKGPADNPRMGKDLRELAWCSIDNEDSNDLDQLTLAQKDPEGNFTLWIAVADVDALVAKDSPIDLHAKINTTSVYTPSKIFPIIPEKLSHNLTSLNEGTDRTAIVIQVKINGQGEMLNSSIFQATVHNFAKLTYTAVSEWLEGRADVPEKVKRISGLKESLEWQHEASQILQKRRHYLGALTLQPVDVEAKVFENMEVILENPSQNDAQELIENFMIAANHVIADYFKKLKIPSLRRVVRTPKRWERIVEIASSLNETLPKDPDSKALEHFLIKRKAADPETFPDLSLTIIKLLGRGEYIVEYPEQIPIGHFGLALSEYTHSTAPNRRYPDLISQRQLKCHLQGQGSPYSLDELQNLALHCTNQEDAATKVERQMKKVAAALLLSSAIGTIYKGIITGAGEKGTWVRVASPPVEGKVVRGFEKLDVGDKVSVELISVDVPKGFINFARVS